MAASSSTSVDLVIINDLVDSADISDDDKLGYLADGEVAVSVNEGTGTSASILDRLRVPTASELCYYNQLDTWHYVAY